MHPHLKAILLLFLLLHPYSQAFSIVSERNRSLLETDGFSVSIDNNPFRIEANQYNYTYLFPEYFGERPSVSFNIADPNIFISPLTYSSEWPGSAHFSVRKEDTTHSYTIKFEAVPYLPHLFLEDFSADTSPLEFTSSRIYLPESHIKKSGTIFTTGGKILMGTIISESAITLTCTKNFILKEPFQISLDALSLSPNSVLSVKVNNSEQILSDSGNRNDTTFQTHRLTFSTSTLNPVIKISTIGKNPHLIDNIRITQNNIPIDTLLKTNNTFYNDEIINIGKHGTFYPFDKITQLKAINFFADEMHTASLFFNNKITTEGAAIVHFTLKPLQWYFIGFPFDIDRITINNTIARSEEDLRILSYDSDSRAFNPETDHFIPIPESTSGSPFPPLNRYKGYIVAIHSKKYPDGATVSFKMSEDNKSRLGLMQDLSVTTPYQDSPEVADENRGIHLMTHPYTSRYLAAPKEILLTFNGINYEYDHPFGIKPFESFFIQSTPDKKKFFNSQRHATYLAPVSEISLDDTKGMNSFPSRLQFKLTESNLTDKTDIRFDELATNDFDPGLDLAKIESPHPNAPHLYSFSDSISYAIQTLPPARSLRTVRLHIKAKRSGIHSLELAAGDEESSFAAILLKDKHTNDPTSVNLKEDTYSFLLYKGEEREVEIQLHPLSPDYKNNKGGYTLKRIGSVTFLSPKNRSDIRLFNSSGQLVFQRTTPAETTEQILLKEKGIYILHIRDKNGTYREKLYN